MAEFPKSLAKALFAIQGELSGVVKDSSNPHYKSKYASLEAVIETARPSMQEHGVVFMQSPGEYRDGALSVTTSLIHAETGECIHSTVSAPLSKQDPQGAGSCITYLCRYSLMALLGIPPVDDDGQVASGRDKVQLPKAQSRDNYKALENGIDECKSVEQLRLWAKANKGLKDTLPTDWQFSLSARYEDKMHDLKQHEMA